MCDRRSRLSRRCLACRVELAPVQRSQFSFHRACRPRSGGSCSYDRNLVSISTRLGGCSPITWRATPFCIVHEGVRLPRSDEIGRMHSRQDLALRKALSAEIKARRAILGINQEELAHAAGIGRASLARLETGVASPKLGSLFRLAAGLETDPGDFVSSIAKRYRKETRSQ